MVNGKRIFECKSSGVRKLKDTAINYTQNITVDEYDNHILVRVDYDADYLKGSKIKQEVRAFESLLDAQSFLVMRILI